MLKSIVLFIIVAAVACTTVTITQIRQQPTCMRGNKQAMCLRQSLEQEKYNAANRQYWKTCYNCSSEYCQQLSDYIDKQYVYMIGLNEICNKICADD